MKVIINIYLRTFPGYILEKQIAKLEKIFLNVVLLLVNINMH